MLHKQIDKPLLVLNLVLLLINAPCRPAIFWKLSEVLLLHISDLHPRKKWDLNRKSLNHQYKKINCIGYIVLFIHLEIILAWKTKRILQARVRDENFWGKINSIYQSIEKKTRTMADSFMKEKEGDFSQLLTNFYLLTFNFNFQWK